MTLKTPTEFQINLIRGQKKVLINMRPDQQHNERREIKSTKY